MTVYVLNSLVIGYWISQKVVPYWYRKYSNVIATKTKMKCHYVHFIQYNCKIVCCKIIGTGLPFLNKTTDMFF